MEGGFRQVPFVERGTGINAFTNLDFQYILENGISEAYKASYAAYGFVVPDGPFTSIGGAEGLKIREIIDANDNQVNTKIAELRALIGLSRSGVPYGGGPGNGRTLAPAAKRDLVAYFNEIFARLDALRSGASVLPGSIAEEEEDEEAPLGEAPALELVDEVEAAPAPRRAARPLGLLPGPPVSSRTNSSVTLAPFRTAAQFSSALRSAAGTIASAASSLLPSYSVSALSEAAAKCGDFAKCNPATLSDCRKAILELSSNKLNPNGCAQVKIFGFYLDQTKRMASDPKTLAINYYSAISKVIDYGRDQAKPPMLEYVAAVGTDAKVERLIKVAQDLQKKLDEVKALIQTISSFR